MTGAPGCQRRVSVLCATGKLGAPFYSLRWRTEAKGGFGEEVNRLSQAGKTLGGVIHSTRLLGTLELAWGRAVVTEVLEGMTGTRGTVVVCV